MPPFILIFIHVLSPLPNCRSPTGWVQNTVIFMLLKKFSIMPNNSCSINIYWGNMTLKKQKQKTKKTRLSIFHLTCCCVWEPPSVQKELCEGAQINRNLSKFSREWSWTHFFNSRCFSFLISLIYSSEGKDQF